MDIAAGYPFAIGFRDEFQKREYSLYYTPSVVVELDYLSKNGTDEQIERASEALDNLKGWKVTPFIPTDVQKRYRANFMALVEKSGLLPAGERNDARILADTSIAEIPILVTSDHGLLEADRDALTMVFNDAGLSPVSVVSPRKLWNIYGKR